VFLAASLNVNNPISEYRTSPAPPLHNVQYYAHNAV
jgi:hypothetical protein